MTVKTSLKRYMILVTSCNYEMHNLVGDLQSIGDAWQDSTAESINLNRLCRDTCQRSASLLVLLMIMYIVL